MVTLTDPGTVQAMVSEVSDPEVPVLTIGDLGILRDVQFHGERVVVTITPTYSGCPAMEVIASDILGRLREAGYVDSEVRTVLSPAWTTDWMSDEGRHKLEEFGIAPPHERSQSAHVVLELPPRCPRCHSINTRQVSRFGSTACKAFYTCNACLEPFDYFKAI
jgi:ring-1,2-phenylacetyl-CoA epoxidase subunit PaaD